MNINYKEFYKRRLVESILNDHKNLNEAWWNPFDWFKTAPKDPYPNFPSRRPYEPDTPGPGGTIDTNPRDPNNWPGLGDLPARFQDPIRKRFPDSYGPGGEDRIFRPTGNGYTFKIGKKTYYINSDGRIVELPPGFKFPAIGGAIPAGLLGYDANGNPIYLDPSGNPAVVSPENAPTEATPGFGREFQYDPYYNPAGEYVND